MENKEKTLEEIKTTYNSLRKVEVFGETFILKLIKTVANKGYDEVVEDFKNTYKKVMTFISINENLQRIIANHNIETDYNILSQWNKDCKF